jgi:hypothetical protein
MAKKKAQTPAKKAAKKTIAQPPEGASGEPTATDDAKRIKAEQAERERLVKEAKDNLEADKKHPLWGKYKCYKPTGDDIVGDHHNFTLDVEHDGNIYRFAIEEEILRPHEAERFIDMRLERDERIAVGHGYTKHGT